jgi:hypothetical protein
MKNSIEALDRKRNRLLSWILAVYGVWHGILLLLTLIAFIKFGLLIRHFMSGVRLYILIIGVVALAVFLFFIIRWLIYKRTLKKNPETAMAVNDERVKQNWLMAYRTSFIVMISLAVILEILKIASNAIFIRVSPPPDEHLWWHVLAFLDFYHLQIVIYAGIVTCLVSFLRRNWKG